MGLEMSKSALSVKWLNEDYGELWGIASAFHLSGGDQRLVDEIKALGFWYHEQRQCWYTYDPAARLLFEDILWVRTSMSRC
jgi:hypothetical protein